MDGKAIISDQIQLDHESTMLQPYGDPADTTDVGTQEYSGMNQVRHKLCAAGTMSLSFGIPTEESLKSVQEHLGVKTILRPPDKSC